MVAHSNVKLLEGIVYRQCAHCNHNKHFSEFDRDKCSKGGITYLCKPCRRVYRNRPECKLQRLNYSQKPEIKARSEDQRLRRKYGISLNEYNKKLEEQDYLCEICSEPQTNSKKFFHVDHDHSTNKVRGILCSSCNTSLGLLKEDIQLLQKVISYLIKYKD